MPVTTRKQGIEAYKYEQKLLKRLIKIVGGKLTAKRFDELFTHRKHRFEKRAFSKTPETFILGLFANGGTRWAKYLELLQIMASLGDVKINTENDQIVYSL